MNYQDSTGKSIQTAFNEFHFNNPTVYEHFKRLSLKAIRAGKKKISAKMICNVIRWEVFIQTVDNTLYEVSGEPVRFKLNDVFISRYSRLFVTDFPEHADKLEMREIRSA